MPGLSVRTLKRDIQKSGMCTGSAIQVIIIQVCCLYMHCHIHACMFVDPNARCCCTEQLQQCVVVAQGDGCDLVTGLQESVKSKWYGDVDLNNGKLQVQYTAYKALLAFLFCVGLDVPSRQSQLSRCLSLLT